MVWLSFRWNSVIQHATTWRHKLGKLRNICRLLEERVRLEKSFVDLLLHNAVKYLLFRTIMYHVSHPCKKIKVPSSVEILDKRNWLYTFYIFTYGLWKDSYLFNFLYNLEVPASCRCYKYAYYYCRFNVCGLIRFDMFRNTCPHYKTILLIILEHIITFMHQSKAEILWT